MTNLTKQQRAELKGKRVELHPGCDLWMRGARFGEITNVSADGVVSVKMDHKQVKRIQKLPRDRVTLI